MYNHTQGQVSGPMRANTANKKYTDKQSTKEVLWEEIEGGFISIKKWLTPTGSYTQPAPSSRPYFILQGKQIGMSGLYMAHRKFKVTPK